MEREPPHHRSSVHQAASVIGAAWLVALMSGTIAGCLVGGPIGGVLGTYSGAVLGIPFAPVYFWLLRRKDHLLVFAFLAMFTFPIAAASGALGLPIRSIQVATIAAYVAGMFVAHFVLKDSRTRHPNRCARCEYDLPGNISGICPECGSPIPEPPAADSSSCTTLGK